MKKILIIHIEVETGESVQSQQGFDAVVNHVIKAYNPIHGIPKETAATVIQAVGLIAEEGYQPEHCGSAIHRASNSEQILSIAIKIKG